MSEARWVIDRLRLDYNHYAFTVRSTTKPPNDGGHSLHAPTFSSFATAKRIFAFRSLGSKSQAKMIVLKPESTDDRD